ncbi:hypothetical protein FISHEDRAFT_63373 [Fistulina hepatica ATCC 64428]|uniref:RING-type domain-containing protein n=1 Tax=Fistulina hepatica ATCC 64428 TaxID=1128425 RepID=A0A0D7AP57_9AGAR|nr:hypothetical protein FISHEDRAFT_63373 [Fistulina hepatica ATCC 64428]
MNPRTHVPLPVVSSASSDADDADECPVCLEPLSFSFRLPGEKPHIVPECGHALHEACFAAVYGPPPSSRDGGPRKTGLGVCGVCRRPMKIGDGDTSGKSNKLASLTGMKEAAADIAQVPTQGPAEDDHLDHAQSVRSGGGSGSAYVVAPSIQVRPEFASLTRNADASQALTCIVVVELPAKRPAAAVPGPVVSETYASGYAPNTYANPNNGTTPRPFPPSQAQNGGPSPRSGTPLVSPNAGAHSQQLSEDNTGIIHDNADTPFSAITADLRARIADWKGHPLSDLGALQMYDLLTVRRDAIVREFYVYLFKEALICVVEEKKRSLGRLLGESAPAGAGGQTGKGILRLKGRIYVRHIRQVTATSAAGEMSLTIDMEDELASFILIFKERGTLEAWKSRIEALVAMFQRMNGIAQPQPVQEPPLSMEEFGGSAKAMRMLSGATGLVTPYTSNGPSNALTPLPHPPLDLILVISVPPPGAPASTATLKVRVIRSTLEFLLASLTARDRVSLVTFEVGAGGRVRKTPFLSPGRPASRRRLDQFIDGVAFGREGGPRDDDEFLIRGNKDEKTDVVTAVNHGLDVVLQRKTRNPVGGMILVSDAADSTRRAQMDLVLARAEAANVPIHSFGYGRSHDPASLWLMSNHTSGTYTFVSDWYDLRECVAGCVGGMMSIGLLSMKLHMRVVDGQRFRIRKVSGGPTSILASDGLHVDVDIGELRYGERKEMLVEMELDNADVQARRAAIARAASQQQSNRNVPANATDQFVASLGLDALDISDTPDFADGMMDRMIDEVPVVEVDGSFFDPASSKHITRLSHPVLLTITLLPPPTPDPYAPGDEQYGRAAALQNQPGASDPVIVRRRMELLASDMITRALVLVSRRNFAQAQKIMGETKRILHTVLQTISRSLTPPNAQGPAIRNRKELLTLAAVRTMQAILQDLQLLSEALEENVELFAHDQRNFGAQQAMILRDQKSWSGRSATERLFWTTDNSIELVARSTDWVANE